ncbi:MAG: hypothetical protein ACI4LA_02745 [Emergencia sp.]
MNRCNESMVYLTKVFSDQQVKSCPLMRTLTTSPACFDQQLTLMEGSGCGCSSSSCCAEISEDTTFAIESTEVFISSFDLAHPEDLMAQDVTVNGLPVDSIETFNERYMASTNNLMSRISDCECMERGESTKGFMLVSCAGPWKARLTLVIRGSLFTCSGCKKFKLILTSRKGTEVTIPGTSTFAADDICLPCTTGGIAPIINFSFSAEGRLLNPELMRCGEASEERSSCALILTGSLITEPVIHVQVTRQTLFRTPDERVKVPCDDLARCAQAPGRCSCEEDDDSNALRLSGRCCDDACREEEEEEDECRRERRRDEDDCGCRRERRRDEDDRRRRSCADSVSFQWNGCCGCRF